MRPLADGEVDPADAVRGLFLILKPGDVPSAGRLDALLGEGGVIGVLFESTDGMADLRDVCRGREVGAFASTIQDAQDLDADGVLIDRVPEVEQARRRLGPERVVGARAKVSRHDAMVAGEAGADFIAFGDLDHPVTERLIEILGWWSDLFVLPTLALAAPLDHAGAARLADARADFLGVRPGASGHDPDALADLATAFNVTGRPVNLA